MYQLRNMGDATWYSFTNSLNTFMGFIPSLIGALIALVVGWFISCFLARLIARGPTAKRFPHSDVYTPRMGDRFEPCVGNLLIGHIGPIGSMALYAL